MRENHALQCGNAGATHPGDANFGTVDSNLVLYLTMDEDKSVEAGFKCGSGMPPFVAMSLLALVVGVVIRRLT